jgi:cation transport ATPase
MAPNDAADRVYLLYTLPALAVAAPLLALAGLVLGVGPAPALARICNIFLIVSPATGLLGLRTLSRVGSAAPEWAHRTARRWCALAIATPVVVYLGLRWLAERGA